jgi:DNA-binding NtrC family response regulator
LKGVLYLDHHTIPALFEKEDVTFIHAIANFISVLLQTVSEYSNQVFINRQLTEDIQRLGGRHGVITQNATMSRLFSKIPEIAKSNASVLLIGESGTGKEILAQMIHDESLRSRGPMIKLNCAAIAPSMIESELFGVAKNAATGVNERDGKLWEADNGTLFFDEIGDMPLEIQSKILRPIEYQQFEKVGSNRLISTDIRFIYATNKNLKDLIKQGKFREDLFYRINTVTIYIPPLSERTDDIPLLLSHFLKIFCPDEKRRPIFSSAIEEILMSYQWPGNVRELKNFVENCCIYFSGKKVEFSDLSAEIKEHRSLASTSKEKAENIEKARIRENLTTFKGNQSQVARLMKIPLSTLRRKIKKYKIF